MDVSLPATGFPVSLDVPNLIMFSLDPGDSAIFQCTARGLPLPEIVWSKDGILILPSGNKVEVNSRATMDGNGLPILVSVLTVNALLPRDAGSYNCRAFNNISSLSLELPYILTVSPLTTDFCTPNPCQNGGSCTSGLETFECHCDDGYTGIICDTGL